MGTQVILAQGLGQPRRPLAKPVMQGLLGALDGRQTGPEGLVQIQGDEFDGVHGQHSVGYLVGPPLCPRRRNAETSPAAGTSELLGS